MVHHHLRLVHNESHSSAFEKPLHVLECILLPRTPKSPPRSEGCIGFVLLARRRFWPTAKRLGIDGKYPRQFRLLERRWLRPYCRDAFLICCLGQLRCDPLIMHVNRGDDQQAVNISRLPHSEKLSYEHVGLANSQVREESEILLKDHP